MVTKSGKPEITYCNNDMIDTYGQYALPIVGERTRN